MGTKGATGYFQGIMAFVLAGLLFSACELYIDDCITAATGEREFISNLRNVLRRFSEKHIFVNPAKTKLGMKQVEYVGHTLSKDGYAFTDEKKDSVITAERPGTGKQLRSFLGLANHFREHVIGFGKMSRPLEQMLLDYNSVRYRRLEWTEESEAAFEALKIAIHNCCTIANYDESLLVEVHTDASDYGVGGVIFQRRPKPDGTTVFLPLAIVSHALSSEQVRWDTMEKEAYAIHYLLEKFDYLLRDVKFRLRTDHKNLIFLNSKAKPKLRRWKIAVQGFTFDVEHIPGVDNVIADVLSRCQPISQEVKETLLSMFRCYRKEGSTASDDGILGKSVDSACSDGNDKVWYFAPMRNLVIPANIRELILRVHNSLTGHWGVQNTLQSLRKLIQDEDLIEGGEIPHDAPLRAYVELFVQKCSHCQKTSHIRKRVTTMPFIRSTNQLFERINVDTSGPYAKDEDGNRYIISVIDCFSKYIVLFPAKDATAESAAQALIGYFSIYGDPQVIQSDKGGQFASDIVRELTRLMQMIHKVETLPYSHQENALVERSHLETQRHLRNILHDTCTSNKWSRLIPFVQRIMNNHVHSSTGVSPMDLVMPWRKVEPVMIHRPVDRAFTLADWSEQLLDMQMKVIRSAREHLGARDKAHLAHAGMPSFYEVNDYVLEDATYKSELKRAKEGKLHCRWKGPLQVISVSADLSTYVVKDVVNNKEHAVHIKNLKPFQYDPEFTDPYSVALKDTESFVVAEISDMRGKFTAKTSKTHPLTFRVKWKGFTAEHDTWEPWANLRYNVILHQWMRDHGHARYIPKQSVLVEEDARATDDEDEELLALVQAHGDYSVQLHYRIASYKP